MGTKNQNTPTRKQQSDTEFEYPNKQKQHNVSLEHGEEGFIHIRVPLNSSSILLMAIPIGWQCFSRKYKHGL